MKSGRARFVAPLQVVEFQHDGPCAGTLGDDLREPFEQAIAVRRVAAVEDGRSRRRLELAQRVDEQRERPDRFGFVRGRLEHERVGVTREICGRIQQPALADPGLAEQQHGAATALLERGRHRGAELLELGIAADEA